MYADQQMKYAVEQQQMSKGIGNSAYPPNLVPQAPEEGVASSIRTLQAVADDLERGTVQLESSVINSGSEGAINQGAPLPPCTLAGLISRITQSISASSSRVDRIVHHLNS